MWEGRNCNNAFPDGIVNGAKWYSVVGSMQDYNYLVSNAFDVTLELSCTKDVAASELREEWKNNKEAMLKYMVWSICPTLSSKLYLKCEFNDEGGDSHGRGRVCHRSGRRRGRGGQGIRSQFFESIDRFFSTRGEWANHFQIHVEAIGKPILTTKRGEYWRLLAPGRSYKLHATKDGYKASEKKTITMPGNNSWPPKFQNVEFKIEKEI